jgi:hypothetical protein
MNSINASTLAKPSLSRAPIRSSESCFIGAFRRTCTRLEPVQGQYASAEACPSLPICKPAPVARKRPSLTTPSCTRPRARGCECAGDNCWHEPAAPALCPWRKQRDHRHPSRRQASSARSRSQRDATLRDACPERAPPQSCLPPMLETGQVC